MKTPIKYIIIIAVCTLLASAINIAGVFVLQRFGVIATAETDMKNLPYGFAVAINLVLALLSFPVFFNLTPRVRANVFYSAASFFVLPLLATISFTLAFAEEGWFAALLGLPYLIILTIFFIGSRRSHGKI
ncbi:hypothetical protein [Pedobacter sp. SYP-B3415]|uniref:hypothetical protein n=1 Tax=Pedobacter sp. SYP-B3415 TaxID=2496641 RepID=UPI00101D6B2F|nr:hypothetical protein [Pedobacter sp. SYP-B3415]